MIRCETCLIALQIADRENNNCPTCKDYKGYKLKIVKENLKSIAKYGELLGWNNKGDKQ